MDVAELAITGAASGAMGGTGAYVGVQVHIRYLREWLHRQHKDLESIKARQQKLERELTKAETRYKHTLGGEYVG